MQERPDSYGVDRQASRSQSQQIPNNLLAKEFGKVYVRDDGADRHVEFTVWVQELSGAMAEGWQTGIALDASASMKDWYGRNLTGRVPKDVLAEYSRHGWTSPQTFDGATVTAFKKQAYDDALKRGFLKFTPNIVEPLARDFIAYLARELDANGKATVAYWACGEGDAYEVLGDFTPDQCPSLEIRGPRSVSFGKGTRLAPCLKYFIERYKDAKRAMYVFITDGRLDDLEQVKLCTTELARGIQEGQRGLVKCVLVGVGSNVDEKQMEELDDLDTGTDVDVWDHKVAKEMRALSEIMVELVGDVQEVSAEVIDASGNVVAKFTDGLPPVVTFSMPIASDFFELAVGDKRIRQSVVVGKGS